MTAIFGAAPIGDLTIMDDQGQQSTISYPAKPSKRLVRYVEGLPRGSTIAVDQFSPHDYEALRVRFNGTVVTPTRDEEYYRRILRVAYDKRMKVVFLQSPENFINISRLVMARQELEEKINKIDEDTEEGAVRIHALHQLMYSHVTEFNFHSLFTHEENILKTVREQSPAAVITTDEAANYLFFNNQDLFAAYHRETLPSQDFVAQRFSAYLHEGNGPLAAERLLKANMPQNRFVENAQRAEDVARHETILRKYRALKYGRFSTHTPDYAGCWGVNPALGYMELDVNAVEGSHMRGIYTDVYGISPFHGRITPSEIEFTRVDEEGKRMFFYGERNGNAYEGCFDHPDIEGTFVLRSLRGHEC